jgi:hypothetical protein
MAVAARPPAVVGPIKRSGSSQSQRVVTLVAHARETAVKPVRLSFTRYLSINCPERCEVQVIRIYLLLQRLI